jgi:peptide deformylase
MPDEWIRQLGDRLPVPGISLCDGILRAQVQRMTEMLDAAEGAGLAATQVGILQRAFVYRLWPGEPIEALVNPTVISSSLEQSEFLEGCLSFQAVTVRVTRPDGVRVGGLDLDGRTRTLDFEGVEASLVQHEIDHLDGILTLDRAAPAERRRALAALGASTAASASPA